MAKDNLGNFNIFISINNILIPYKITDECTYVDFMHRYKTEMDTGLLAYGER